MRYLSLFTGIGGFELGIQKAYESILDRHQTSEKQRESNTILRGADVHTRSELLERAATCIGYSEVDKYAVQIYQRHYPEHHSYGDITKIRETELPDFDLLCGGFPCQAFSIAGKRGGFTDTRGTLFFDIARLLKAKRPRLLLLENVKGLLSHDQGRTFATIIGTLDELGYDCQWQVLNSKDFGVPQNRERVFIVGHLRGTTRPQVFPIGRGGNSATQEYIGSIGVARLPEQTHLSRAHRQQNRVYAPNGVGPTLSSGETQGRHNVAVYDVSYPSRVREYIENAPTVRDYGSGGNKMPMVLTPEFTKIRRLTPTECERLQGFPDGWTDGVSDTQRYKTLGNAVTVNVIEAIISRLI